MTCPRLVTHTIQDYVMTRRRPPFRTADASLPFIFATILILTNVFFWMLLHEKGRRIHCFTCQMSTGKTIAYEFSLPPKPKTAVTKPSLQQLVALQGRPERVQEDKYKWTHSQQGSFKQDVITEIHALLPSSTRLVLIGVFCRAQDVAARTIIRRTSARLAPPAVTIRFVVCKPLHSPPDVLLWAEMQREHDLFLMDCVENMDEGKSIHFFKHVRRQFPAFSYYAKADTDSYVLYHNLALALANAPRTHFYAGRSNFGLNSKMIHNMSGSLYILSQDLVKALEACEEECQDLSGFEDLRTGKILQALEGDTVLQLGDFGKNHSVLYNHWDAVDSPIHPWLVMVHPVKDMTFWWNLHIFFTRTITVEVAKQASKHNFFDGVDSRLEIVNEANMREYQRNTRLLM